jgi:hypothetical protein
MAKRLLVETDKRLLWKLVYNMGAAQAGRVLPAVPLHLDYQ